MDPATNMTPEWVASALAKYPCKLLESGNIRTCPVRLSFPNILKPSRPTENRPEGQYRAVLLFPMGADLSVLVAERNRVALENWPDAGKPGGTKLFNPIRDQDIDGHGQPGESDRFAGYIKGAMRVAASAQQKVPCVDQNMAPIVEDAKVYPGVWAICVLRCYPFTQQGNKGPTFGLQSVMIIADDQNIGGAAVSNPNVDFADVKIESNLNPSELFGAEPATPPAAADSLFA